MKYKSKRLKESLANVDLTKTYSPAEAVALIQQIKRVKFDQTMELALKLNVDPKKADQQVRGSVTLPHGTGKTSKVLVFAKGDKEKEALDAGADYVGAEDLAEKIMDGWLDFTAIVATPDMMRVVGRLGKVLGPRNLMPSPKAGSVTQDVAKAVSEIKKGKIEFKVDKSGNIHTIFGKMSFSSELLLENFNALIESVTKARPASVKGGYIQSISMSSTMGPGLKLDGTKVDHHAAQAG